jgi:hypothetical protein
MPVSLHTVSHVLSIKSLSTIFTDIPGTFLQGATVCTSPTTRHPWQARSNLRKARRGMRKMHPRQRRRDLQFWSQSRCVRVYLQRTAIVLRGAFYGHELRALLSLL